MRVTFPASTSNGIVLKRSWARDAT
jgi:hypothetical protein